MPPRGGPRQAIRILAVAVDNPDDTLTFESYTAAAKHFQVTHHSRIRSALQTQTPINGYKLTQLEKSSHVDLPQTEQQVPSAHGVLTLWEEVDDLFKGSKIRYTTDEPRLVSVYDVIRVMTEHTNTRMAFATMQQNYAEVVRNFTTFQFTGSGERATPVCTVPEIIELINILPGVRAARFRSAGAKVLVRVLGGDDSLVDEIRENSEKMSSISQEDQSNPMNLFKLPNGMTGANATCSLMLAPSMQGKTVADIRGACTYILLFKHQTKLAIKFGWTKDLQKRVREHYRTYPDMKVWSACACQFQEVAVEAEQLFKGKMTAYLQQIQFGNKTSTEVLIGVDPGDAERHMQDAVETVTSELSMHNPLSLKELDIKRLTLELELQKQKTLQQQLEVERMRLQLRLLDDGTSCGRP